MGDSSTGEVTDVGLRREEPAACLPLSSLTTPPCSPSPLGTWTLSNSDLLTYFLPWSTNREALTVIGAFEMPSNYHTEVTRPHTPTSLSLLTFSPFSLRAFLFLSASSLSSFSASIMSLYELKSLVKRHWPCRYMSPGHRHIADDCISNYTKSVKLKI